MSRRNPHHKITARLCEAWGCDNVLPPQSRADRMYCSSRCSERVSRARTRARQRAEQGLAPTRTDLLLAERGLLDDSTATTDPTQITTTRARENVAANASTPSHIGGRGFQNYLATEYPTLLSTGEITQTEIAAALNVTKATVSHWVALSAAIKEADTLADAWAQNESAQSLRAHSLSSFRAFNEVFFPDILVPDFHVEWDDSITDALQTGDRSMLLGPQRHGKTSFVVRQCLYNIALNPNIQIIVVSKTQDLASKTVGVIRQYLENDDQFAHVLLGPNTSFKPPPRRGLPWTNSEFTIATRTQIKKSPTMVALGIGGSILGRDADLIIIDDPIDRAKSLSVTERTRINEWFFTDFNSRIEDHTGVIYLGSRQHKDDLPGEIIRNNAKRMAAGYEPDWNVLIYRAHDPTCTVPLEDHSEDKTDCILWPEYRTARWLAEQQRNNPAHFQRNYLNQPSSDAFRPVSEDDIEWSLVFDEWIASDDARPPRTYGASHARTMLVASVDPAVSKPNAAVLWCYRTVPVSVPIDPHDPNSKRAPLMLRAVVDFATPRPGSPGIVDVIDEWYDQYRVTDWVFETNYFADQIANDQQINDYKSQRGLKFHTHYTSASNKHDTRAGVLAMLSSMQARPTGMLLPSTPEARKAMQPFIHQMLNYDPEQTQSHRRKSNDDDLIMAAWFGWYWIEKRMRSRQTDIVFDYGTGFQDFEPSRWSSPPWKV